MNAEQIVADFDNALGALVDLAQLAAAGVTDLSSREWVERKVEGLLWHFWEKWCDGKTVVR